jgi:hypothetical protein
MLNKWRKKGREQGREGGLPEILEPECAVGENVKQYSCYGK